MLCFLLMRENLEKYIKTIFYDDFKSEGAAEIPNGAKLFKITPKGIKFYESTASKDAKEIPKEAKKVRYNKKDSKIKIDFIGKIQNIECTVLSIEKEIDASIPLAIETIKKNKKIVIPNGASAYKLNSGRIIFYRNNALNNAKKIPRNRNACIISFPEFEKNNRSYSYGKEKFE